VTAVSSRDAKFQLVRALRSVGLLRMADSCKFVLGQIRAWPGNRRFHKEHPGFATPPHHLAFDALNHFDWRAYRETGLQHARMLARVLKAELPPDGPLEVLEWGCGPGRLVRHMAELFPDRQIRLSGADYNPQSIAWCRKNLPGIEFVENALNPPLPFAGEQFDAIYCFSVFSHLSEAVQLDWAGELMRVLKPGGVLACTTVGRGYRHLLAAANERAAFDAGQLVIQGRYREGRKWFLAIHPESYVRCRLLAGWADVRQVPTKAEDNVLQDLWVARKPAARAAI
jgi:SAM-dependent methyltransferase